MHLHLSTQKKLFLIGLFIQRLLFLKTVINNINKYIPNETKVFDDQSPPWINAEIENLISVKNQVFKKHLKNNRNHYYKYNYKALQGTLENLIESLKKSYFNRVSQKLPSISTSSKWYWSLLKRMLNDKKGPVIPPLFHTNNFRSNFKEKSKLFNEYFPKHCLLI